MVSFAPFRKLIQQRGITTYYLRCKCGGHNLGHNTLQRLMTDQSVSTNTIDALCQILSRDVTDLMEVTEDPPQRGKNNRAGVIPAGQYLFYDCQLSLVLTLKRWQTLSYLPSFYHFNTALWFILVKISRD